jgi:apolipoprotein N-acyltransferase
MRSIPARTWALAALSGLLQILPFPIAGPIPLWRTSFAWVALLPLLYALLGMNKAGDRLSPWQSALVGYLTGTIWYAGNCYWIYQTMYLYGGLPKPVSLGILVLFALYLGLYHAAFGAVIGMLRKAGLGKNAILLLVPFAWVALELARARITGFPWDLLGLTQVDNPLLGRLAPLTGVYGISFVLALVNALWLVRVKVKSTRFVRPALAAGAAVVLVGYLLAIHALPEVKVSPPTGSATLLQENLSVGAERKGPTESIGQKLASFSHWSTHPSPTFLAGIPELSRTPEVTMLHRGGTDAQEVPEAEDQTQTWMPKTDLIVWPEAPADFYTTDPEFLQKMHSLADSSQSLLIIGSLGIAQNSQPNPERSYFLYDSATFFRPNEVGVSRYDKIHLVPFGEYIPFKSFLGFAHKLTAGAGDMDRGNSRTVYPYSGHTYAAFVCYESIFGDEIRKFVKNGAQVLVNISDDGWYGDTGAAWQHLNMVRMRAIENHRWILRSTNTGVTAAIDPAGRVVAAAPRHVRTSLHAAFGYEKDVTFYTRWGDLFAYECALVTFFALIGCAFLRRRDLSGLKYFLPLNDLRPR